MMFKKSKEIKELRLENARLRSEKDSMKTERDIAFKDINYWKDLYNKTCDERDKLKVLEQKVREQTKADMVYEALKVIMEGIKPEVTKEEIMPDYHRMQGLQQQMQALRPQGYWGLGGLSGLVGGFQQR